MIFNTLRSKPCLSGSCLDKKNFVDIYLGNTYKSWPLWKQMYPEFKNIIPHTFDSLSDLSAARHKTIYLDGYSGGDSFIFCPNLCGTKFDLKKYIYYSSRVYTFFIR